MNTIIINCPNIPVIIEEINCGVFRHGVIKKTGLQIDPHLTKEVCDELTEKIDGCGKPFQIIINTDRSDNKM
jgi:hypothetical protein